MANTQKSKEPEVQGYYRFTKWLPIKLESGIKLDQDFSFWTKTLQRQGRKFRIVKWRQKEALYVKGEDPYYKRKYASSGHL